MTVSMQRQSHMSQLPIHANTRKQVHGDTISPVTAKCSNRTSWPDRKPPCPPNAAIAHHDDTSNSSGPLTTVLQEITVSPETVWILMTFYLSSTSSSEAHRPHPRLLHPRNLPIPHIAALRPRCLLPLVLQQSRHLLLLHLVRMPRTRPPTDHHSPDEPPALSPPYAVSVAWLLRPRQPSAYQCHEGGPAMR